MGEAGCGLCTCSQLGSLLPAQSFFATMPPNSLHASTCPPAAALTRALVPARALLIATSCGAAPCCPMSWTPS